MNRRKTGQKAVVILIVFVAIFGLMGYKNKVYAASTTVTHVLKQGMQNSEVAALQERLKELNLFSTNVTGYFGNITKQSVVSFQSSNGLYTDGVVGPITADALFNQQQQVLAKTETVSRGDSDRQNVLIPWFNGVEDIFSLGSEAIVTDVDTGISFRVKRTGGTNHSDTETLSKGDTELLKKIFDGKWSWERRAVIVTVGNRIIAASMAGMPHAGRDDKPARAIVSNRSDGYGTGVNYDSIKGNGMSGHFDIHFLNSRTHGTNRVDEKHQAMIQKAAKIYMN